MRCLNLLTTMPRLFTQPKIEYDQDKTGECKLNDRRIFNHRRNRP